MKIEELTLEYIIEKIKNSDYAELKDVNRRDLRLDEKDWVFTVYKSNKFFNVYFYETEVDLLETLNYIKKATCYELLTTTVFKKRIKPMVSVIYENMTIFNQDVDDNFLLDLLKYKISLKEDFLKNEFSLKEDLIKNEFIEL